MTSIRDRIRYHLEALVDDIGARPPGSPANRRATDHVNTTLTAADKPVTTLPFTTRWWEPGTGWLEVDGVRVEVDPNPYSPADDVQGRAVLVGRLSELEELDPDPDLILVLTDELAREQVLPAAFPFLSLPEHERIRTALHRLAPVAVVAVSDHWEPILKDPDLEFPSTTVSTAVGNALSDRDLLRLAVGGAVHTGTGVNLSTRLGQENPRLVLCAHLDSKATTPGAFDTRRCGSRRPGSLPGHPDLPAVAGVAADHLGGANRASLRVWTVATIGYDLSRDPGHRIVLNLPFAPTDHVYLRRDGHAESSSSSTAPSSSPAGSPPSGSWAFSVVTTNG